MRFRRHMRQSDPAVDDPLTLDADTVDGLLSRSLGAEDAPPLYAEVARVLAAAAAPAHAAELTREADIVAIFEAKSVRPASVARIASPVAFAVAGLVVVAGGAAGAATGNLPDRVQDAVSHTLERFGVSVPESGDGDPAPAEMPPPRTKPAGPGSGDTTPDPSATTPDPDATTPGPSDGGAPPGTPPGQGGTPPGQSDSGGPPGTPPDDGGIPAGQGRTPPGQEKKGN